LTSLAGGDAADPGPADATDPLGSTGLGDAGAFDGAVGALQATASNQLHA